MIKDFILDILFPKFCLNCQREGNYLCPDCFFLIDILERQYCPFCWPAKPVIDGKTCKSCCRNKKLTGLFCAASYDEPIIKKLINQFKYQPYLKELSKPLALLIMAHFLKLNIQPEIKFKDFILVPVPLFKKKLKQRNYNQAEEIAKELSKSLKIPLINNALIKIKQTPTQVELKRKQRKKNLKKAFFCQEPKIIENKKILLIDDIFTTGSTLEECAQTLKQARAKQIWGTVIARG